MKVRYLIEVLSNLKPDDEIIVEYWTKSDTEEWSLPDGRTIISDDEWLTAVRRFEKGNGFGEEYAEIMFYLLESNRNGEWTTRYTQPKEDNEPSKKD